MKKTTLFLLTGFLCILTNFVEGTESDTEAIAKAIPDSELDIPLLDIEAAPSSIVGGAVNVITGSYVESVCDMAIPGSTPLTVQRHFNSGNRKRGNLCHGWDLNLPSNIKIIYTEGGVKNPIKAIVNDRGADLTFNGKFGKKMKIINEQLRNGVTNCSTGVISSRTNIRNKKLYYDRLYARHAQLYAETGEILIYKRASDRVHADGLPYSLSTNLLPNGCYIEYDYDDKKRLSRVTTRGMNDNSISYIEWLYPIDFNTTPQLTLRSSDGRRICYKYQKQESYDDQDNHRYCLKSVVRNFGPEMSYEYRYASKHAMERMIKKNFPDNRYLKVQYYEEGNNKVGADNIHISNRKDARVGRVSALYAPVGVNEKPIRIWTFKYYLNKKHRSSEPIGGYAEVTDALGHLKTYRFSDENRLTSVKHFLDNGQLYRVEKMDWQDSGHERTFLLSRGYTDGKGLLLFRRNYAYDEDGNVERETLRGNLTGNGSEAVDWYSYPEAEKYCKTYTYSVTNLMLSESDERKKIVYRYLTDRDLLSLKFVCDTSGVRERYHYVYDSNGFRVREISDDGNSQDINDLSGVTARHIKKIYPTKTKPIGLPEATEEWFLNLETGQEELLTRSENTYSKEGYLLLQKTYDSENKYCYSKEWGYDSQGNVVEEKDALGQITTFRYDKNNNRIYQKTPDRRFHTLYAYDYVNRLIREERVYKKGDKQPCIINSYSYDYMGNRVASTDKYNNQTKYTYDEFGRLIEKIYPQILNSKGKLKHPIDKVGYDLMNNPTIKIDTNGHKTETKYTACGKPYHIVNPDGTIEKRLYHVDSLLEKAIDVNGVETLYTYDYKGRKIKEEKISPKGESLSTSQWIYNAFQLIEEIDPAGYKTVYTYDGAGRKKSVKRGYSETIYVYDSLGRQAETWKMYGAGKYHRTVLEHDYLNRVIHEAIMDERNVVFSKKSYKYDKAGNLTHVIVHDDLCDSCTETEYDCDKRPIKITQPDGTQTVYEYVDNFKNDLGQTVAYKKEIDPKGNQTIQMMDTCGRLAKEEKRDVLNNLLQRSMYCHDGEGNLVSRTDDLFIEGILQKSIRTEFSYDSKNREIEVVEASGEAIQKITRKEYYPSGELAKIIKPDGVILFHKYDYLGRLIDLHASDDSVHYVYEYDQNDNVIKVKDRVHKIETNRTIDENNRMTSEQLGTGLKFSYKYDPRGRVKRLVLPDLSRVEYSYDAANLRTISRKNNGSSLTCKYQFNLSGRIAKIQHPNNLGSTKFTYDSCLRTKSIEQKNWSQSIPECGYDPCGNLIKIHQDDVAGKLTSCYAYDALHHLISETGTAEHLYSFDSLHNRTKKNGILHDINALNQLIQQGNVSYEYDLNGNLSKKICTNKETTYRYDALDGLVAIISENKKTEYLYDSFHRRLRKTTYAKKNNAWTEADACTFLYQGDKEIGALDSRGKVLELRMLGLGNNGEIGAAVLLEIKGLTLCPIHDFRGNLAALINVSNGNLIESYRYTAYGEEQIFDSSGNMQNTSICPWRFSSKRIDPETGWVFFGRRYYDTEIGKWITPDPLRFIDGPNLYCFVHNRPMKYLDPDGRWLSELMQNHYETGANSICASNMMEYGGVEWNVFEAPNYFYYSTTYRVGTPRNDGLAWTYINGIRNSKQESEASAGILSNMAGGREVIGIHNPSYGLGLDLVESALGLCGVKTRPSDLLMETWDVCWANGARHILHNAHSQGMIHTRNTIPSYDKELRQRINVIGIAPAAHLLDDDFGKAVHYESWRDPIPLFDKFAKILTLDFDAIANRAPVVMLSPHPKAGWHDHSINSETFKQPVEDSIQAFFKTYGAVQ